MGYNYSAVSGSAKIVTKGNNCGGNKKAGLPRTWGINGQPNYNAIKSRAVPSTTKPFVISQVNQLGGVGRFRNQSVPSADSVNKNYVLSMQKHCKKTLWKTTFFKKNLVKHKKQKQQKENRN